MLSSRSRIPGLGSLLFLFLGCLSAPTVNADSYPACLARWAQICVDIWPPSLQPDCFVIGIGHCASHTHGDGGFVPLDLPFGTSSSPDFDALMDNDDIGDEYKALAREALAAQRLYHEARSKTFSVMMNLRLLTSGNQPGDEESEDEYGQADKGEQ